MIVLLLLSLIPIVLIGIWIYGCFELSVVSIIYPMKLKDYNPVVVIPDVVKRNVINKIKRFKCQD